MAEVGVREAGWEAAAGNQGRDSGGVDTGGSNGDSPVVVCNTSDLHDHPCLSYYGNLHL